MRAGDHAGGGLVGGKAGAEREAAADALGDGHDVGRDAGPFMGEELARAPDAGLYLVEDEQQAEFVTELAQLLHEFLRHGADAALALHRLDQDAGCFLGDRILDGGDIAERQFEEARRLGAEAFDVFFLTAGRDGRDGAAVEGTVEGKNMELAGMALGEVVAARGLDRAFQRFGSRIGEEHLVGEGRLRQPAAEAFLAGHLIEVGQVPDLVGLVLQRGDEMRMRMAERGDGDAGGEIEISLAIFGDQPDALPAREPERCTHIGFIERRGIGHGAYPPKRDAEKQVLHLTFPGSRKIKSRLSAACCTIGISLGDVNKIAPRKGAEPPAR